MLILGASFFGGDGSAATLPAPSGLRLPQSCKYLPPHEGFGTVIINQNDLNSIRVTGLEGVNGPIVLYYRGTFSSGEIVFMKEGRNLPPEVKLLPAGGDTVFYGNTWGYSVHCEVN
jgi:hypothetical protein